MARHTKLPSCRHSIRAEPPHSLTALLLPFLQRRLGDAAKKAIGKLTTRTVKKGDKVGTWLGVEVGHPGEVQRLGTVALDLGDLGMKKCMGKRDKSAGVHSSSQIHLRSRYCLLKVTPDHHWD